MFASMLQKNVRFVINDPKNTYRPSFKPDLLPIDILYFLNCLPIQKTSQSADLLDLLLQFKCRILHLLLKFAFILKFAADLIYFRQQGAIWYTKHICDFWNFVISSLVNVSDRTSIISTYWL